MKIILIFGLLFLSSLKESNAQSHFPSPAVDGYNQPPYAHNATMRAAPGRARQPPPVPFPNQPNFRPTAPLPPSPSSQLLPLGPPSPAPPIQPNPFQPTPSSTGSLLAHIHGFGVLGFMIFEPTVGGMTSIRARLTGGPPRETYSMKIYSLPMQIGAPCTATSLGSLIHDLSFYHGAITADREFTFQSRIDLLGKDPLLGRTLVLQGISSGIRVCSIILSTDKGNMYQGVFHYPISGILYLMNTNHGTALGTEWLMYSDGTRRETSHRWALYESSPSESTPEARINHEITKCAGLRATLLFDSESRGASRITVSTEMPNLKGKSHQVISGLKPLSSSPVVYIVLFHADVPDKILTCIALSKIEPKKATALFNLDSVQGHIKLIQDSPFEPTRVDINLDLRVPAFSYGIDVLPSIKRRKMETKTCPNIKETIYNPFHIDPTEVPNQGQGTSDQYASGDLSGKYGTLSNKKRENIQSWDFNLPLFGYFSVIGRAVVIYAPDGPSIGCANLDLDDNELTTAYATFDSPLQGQFIMRQAKDHCFSDTYIYIEISKHDSGNVSKTVNHPWHVHVNPVETVETLSTTVCGPAGPHFNPFNVSTACIYQRDCTIFTPNRCEAGDQANKLGAIDVPPYKPTPSGGVQVGKYYFIDSDLSLCGPNSIVGKSIVIHDKDYGSPRVTCANIFQFKPSV